MQADWVFEGNSLEKLKTAQRRERKLERLRKKIAMKARSTKRERAKKYAREKIHA